MRGGGVEDGLGFDLADDFRRYDSEFFINVPTWRFPLEVLLLLVKGSPTDNDGQVWMRWDRCASPLINQPGPHSFEVPTAAVLLSLHNLILDLGQ